MVTTMVTGKAKKIGMTCQRCGGRMIFEKFYDVNNVFFAWHCVICGEILDAVILLHRLSQDADLRIPEEKQGSGTLVQSELACNPEKKGENEQVFERDVQSLEETIVNEVKPSKFNLPDYPLGLGSLDGNVRPP